MNTNRLFPTLLFMMLSSCAAGTPAVVAPEAPAAEVVVLDSPDLLVIDGDTFRRERIRILGVDTPERGEPGFYEAKVRLAELLKSGSVTMAPRGRDVYGRTLAHVFVDGRDVGRQLKEEGYDKSSRKTPTK